MPRPKSDNLPAGIRKRKTAKAPFYTYEINFFDGKRQHFERLGTDLRHAKRRLAERRREIAEGTFSPGGSARDRVTVREFAKGWLDEREGEVITIDDDRTRFDRHILPVLGDLRVSEVTSADIVAFLQVLKGKKGARGKPLAANTIKTIYGNVVTMFADAEQQGYTIRTPCTGVRKGQLPRKPPRSETQGTALSADELSSLISDESIPRWRSVFYTLMFIGGGPRFGEAAGLRWSDYDRTRHPLGHLRVERQYNGKPLKGKRGEPGPARDIPVHPVLASELAEWKLSGFAEWVGRSPEPDDFIVPDLDGSCLSLRKVAYWMAKDAAAVGLELRQATHIARRTFVTLAMAGGASEAWVRRITHNANGDVLTGYTVNDWPAMCQTVLCVKIERRAAIEVVKIGRAGES